MSMHKSNVFLIIIALLFYRRYRSSFGLLRSIKRGKYSCLSILRYTYSLPPNAYLYKFYHLQRIQLCTSKDKNQEYSGSWLWHHRLQLKHCIRRCLTVKNIIKKTTHLSSVVDWSVNGLLGCLVSRYICFSKHVGKKGDEWGSSSAAKEN